MFKLYTTTKIQKLEHVLPSVGDLCFGFSPNTVIQLNCNDVWQAYFSYKDFDLCNPLFITPNIILNEYESCHIIRIPDLEVNIVRYPNLNLSIDYKKNQVYTDIMYDSWIEFISKNNDKTIGRRAVFVNFLAQLANY